MKTSPSEKELLAWIRTVATKDFVEFPQTFDLRQAETVVDVELWLYNLKRDAERFATFKDISHLRNVVIDRLRKAWEIWSLENTRRLQEMLF